VVYNSVEEHYLEVLDFEFQCHAPNMSNHMRSVTRWALIALAVRGVYVIVIVAGPINSRCAAWSSIERFLQDVDLFSSLRLFYTLDFKPASTRYLSHLYHHGLAMGF
jgi:hypothetical protein